MLKETLSMEIIERLAHEINAASDEGNEELLSQLGEECELRLSTAEGEARVLLRYFQANTYGGIIESKSKDANYSWSWELPDYAQNLFLLRRAIGDPAFETADPILRCQIRTNLANRLKRLSRPVAANEQYLKVLEIDPHFAKALLNCADAIGYYAADLYDNGHTGILLAAARDLLDSALDRNAHWESDDRDSFAPQWGAQRNRIAAYLEDVDYNEQLDLDQWSLGTTEEERTFRRWCLHRRLFLNPLNEAYTDSVAASDVFHLPSHIYKVGEAPRFPAYYNLLKQEYVSARYRLYKAVNEDDLNFLMRDVLMLDSGQSQALGHYTEELRSAFRSAYSIFDKIGLFLNDYFRIGIEPKRVLFRKIWFEKPGKPDSKIRPIFKDSGNWPLRGLFFLSKDLFDEAFQEVAEPDAADLARLRQQVEHRFLSFQHFPEGEPTETHGITSICDFQRKTLRLLKMAREAIIYLSLAMHCEEARRKAESESGNRIISSLGSWPIDFFKHL